MRNGIETAVLTVSLTDVGIILKKGLRVSLGGLYLMILITVGRLSHRRSLWPIVLCFFAVDTLRLTTSSSCHCDFPYGLMD